MATSPIILQNLKGVPQPGVNAVLDMLDETAEAIFKSHAEGGRRKRVVEADALRDLACIVRARQIVATWDVAMKMLKS